MNAIRRWWQGLRYRPKIALLVSKLRDEASERESGDILNALQTALERALRRRVFVFKTEAASQGVRSGGSGPVGAWITEASCVHAWVQGGNSGQRETINASGQHIEALVPIVIGSETIVAMIAISGKRLRRLSARQCSLVDAAIGMTALLMQQAQLRQEVDAAEALSGVVRRLAEAQRLQREIKAYLDSSRN